MRLVCGCPGKETHDANRRAGDQSMRGDIWNECDQRSEQESAHFWWNWVERERDQASWETSDEEVGGQATIGCEPVVSVVTPPALGPFVL